MVLAGTIVGTRFPHNRAVTGPRRARPHIAITAALLASMIAWAATGCAAPERTPAEPDVTVWQLAQAELVKPVILGRARVPHDRPLPLHLVHDLSPTYQLVLITKDTDWQDARRRFQLPPAPAEVDLSRGLILGILARVGENADGKWPIHLRSVRTHAGQGRLEAAFTPGIYHPLLTAGYLELAYVPGVHSVRMVQIGNLIFAIRSTASPQ